MFLDYIYKDNWYENSNYLYYVSNDYVYNKYVLIVDFNKEVFSKFNRKKRDTAKFNEIVTTTNDLISIVVLTNNYNNIKFEFEKAIRDIEFKVLLICSLKRNRIAKPHTGMYAILNRLYKEKIEKSLVVTSSHTDICFAKNCNLQYVDFKNFIENNNSDDEMGIYNCIPLSIRSNYINEINNKETIDIIQHILSLKKTLSYVIAIIGPPSSGKKTLANKIIEDWCKSSLNDNNAIVISKKVLNYVKESISVITINKYHIAENRIKLEESIKKYNTQIIYIYVNVGGSRFSFLLNHVKVALSSDLKNEFYDIKEFIKYDKSQTIPNNCLIYYPKIIPNKFLLEFSY